AVGMTARDVRGVGAEERRRHRHAVARSDEHAEREVMALEAPGPGRAAGRIAEHHKRVVAGIAEAGAAAELAQDALDRELAAHLVEPARAEQRAEQVPGG